MSLESVNHTSPRLSHYLPLDVKVRFECTPFTQFHLNGKKVSINEAACSVRNLDDARDSIFDGLTIQERSQIASAFVGAMGAKS